jgi:uncharacterized protein (DUF305 family)
MGIPMSKASTILGAALSAAALVIALSGCGMVPTLPMAGDHPTGSQEDAPDTETTEDAFAVSDLMFAAMMIPHHQQAVDMSNSALDISDSPEIRDLASRIRDGQLPEINQMQGWLDASGFDGDDFPGDMMGPMGQSGLDPIEGMPGMESMGGMATEEEIATLSGLNSPEFDQEFLRLMIDHHEGALVMIHMIDNSSVDEVRELADDIDRVQRDEIAEMKDLQEGFESE